MSTKIRSYSQAVSAAVNQLSNIRRDYQSYVSAIESDGRFSDAYKEELIGRATESHRGDAYQSAKLGWATAKQARDVLEAQMQRYHREFEATKDYARQAVLMERYKGLLAAPVNPFKKESPSSRLASVYREALRMGDADALRALRAVGIAQLAGADQQRDPAGRDLLRRMQADEAADAPPEFAEARADLEAVEYHTRILEQTIRNVERTFDPSIPAEGSAFDGPSPWSRDILGESWESRGGGVQWRQNAGPATWAIDDADDDDPEAA